MAKEKIIGVHWKARSYLGDVEFLDRETECTYFRLIQFVYLTQDRLEDDDRKLWQRCKCRSIHEYRKHKAELMKPRGIDPATGQEIPPRVTLQVGIQVGSQVTFIRIDKCSEQLGTASRLRSVKSMGGKASAKQRKTLKDNNSPSTPVGTERSTEQSTHGEQNAQHNGNRNPQQNGLSVDPTLKDVLTEHLLLTSTTEQASGSSGLTPAARPSIPERVTVTIAETGCVIRINAWGIFDIIGGPRDCEPPELTPAEAIALRDAELAKTQPPQNPAPVAEKPSAPETPAAKDDFDPECDRPAFLDARRHESPTVAA